MQKPMYKVDRQLRFYFLTDDHPAAGSVIQQVQTALNAGATMVQYRNKRFSLSFYRELRDIREICREAGVPLIVNDHVLLAKAVAADGVHLGQGDDSPQLAREILGPRALIGISVSSTDELIGTPLDGCDYVGCGPVFATDTKADANPACGLGGLADVVARSPIPVVAIGGISAANAAQCMEQGAKGVSVISAVTRAPSPEAAAREIAAACGL